MMLMLEVVRVAEEEEGAEVVEEEAEAGVEEEVGAGVEEEAEAGVEEEVEAAAAVGVDRDETTPGPNEWRRGARPPPSETRFG